MSQPLYSDLDFQGLTGKNVGTPDADDKIAPKGYVDTGVAAAKQRSNHLGVQPASTISDFDTQVRTSRLDQMAVPTSDVNLNSHTVTNLRDATAAQEPATKAQLDAAIAGVLSNQRLKNTVRVAVSTNVNIASAPSAFDGVTATTGDIILLYGQTTGSQNGPYTFNGAGSAMTRATNWDTQAEAVVGSYWIVQEGTKADNFALMTNDTFTLGTTTAAFQFISVAGAAIGRYAVDCPSVSAGGSWSIVHSLNSKDITVQYRRNSDDSIFNNLETIATDVNTLTAKPSVALASGAVRVIVKY